MTPPLDGGFGLAAHTALITLSLLVAAVEVLRTAAGAVPEAIAHQLLESLQVEVLLQSRLYRWLPGFPTRLRWGQVALQTLTAVVLFLDRLQAQGVVVELIAAAGLGVAALAAVLHTEHQIKRVALEHRDKGLKEATAQGLTTLVTATQPQAVAALALLV
jgi:hypothetical protein